MLPFRCSACLRDLSNLRHEAAHFLRGLLLHLSCGVGVSAEGEARVVVTQHRGYCFHIHTVLECQGRERMSQVVKSDVRQSSVLQDLLVQVYDGVWVVHLTGCRRGEHVGILRMLTMLCWGSCACKSNSYG